MGFKASIIITSYNQRATLELLIESLKLQTEKNFEVIIADDGSSDGTDALIRNTKLPNVIIVTQPDVGYRKAKIVNEAIRCAQAPYLIFLDGDVILEKHFVQDHLDLKKIDHFVCGRRVELGPEFSKTIEVKDVASHRFNRLNLELLKSCLSKDSTHFNRSIRITNKLIRRVFKYDHAMDILGCNFSAWKKDIFAINGFNESMESYWGEDGDIYIRLRNIGKKPIGVKAKCVQFHVFHKRREPTPENVSRYQKLLNDYSYKWAQNGLEKNPS